MTAIKEPELQIKTTLAKFAGFLKALALIGILIGGTTGATYFTNDKIDEDIVAENKARDSLIIELRNDIDKHELRIQSVENTNVEVKSSLVIIQSDIKKLLYLAGKNER